MTAEPLTTDEIAGAIVVIRGCRVLLDTDLARLYGVEVKALNQAVKRNLARFPGDFAFQLQAEEPRPLRSQYVTLEPGRGRHRKFQPWAFTEQGVAMLSSVLRSPRAIAVNIQIMRAFVGLRRLADGNADLTRRLDALEARYDGQSEQVFRAIRALRTSTPPHSMTGRTPAPNSQGAPNSGKGMSGGRFGRRGRFA
jgi:hypothetical protein